MNGEIALDVEGMLVQRGHGPEGFRISLPRLRLRRGCLTALSGRSGSGKSTVLEALAFLRAATFDAHGHFLIACRDRDGLSDVTVAVAAWRPDELARQRARSVGYVPQTHVLLPYVSAYANMLLAVPPGRREGIRARIVRIAGMLGIADVLHRRPDRLSVGQRQRVAIGRALMAGAPVLLVDEPTAALDRANAEAVGQILLETARTGQVAVLVATHDPELAALCDERLVIRMSANRAEVHPA